MKPMKMQVSLHLFTKKRQKVQKKVASFGEEGKMNFNEMF